MSSAAVHRRWPALALIAATALLSGCQQDAPRPALVADADPANGRLLLRQFGCGDCHRIPGVADARGETGPPLQAMPDRVYLAGRLPNTPEQLVAFIVDPQQLVPGTAMPDLDVGPAHARDIAAWLLGPEAQ